MIFHNSSLIFLNHMCKLGKNTVKFLFTLQSNVNILNISLECLHNGWSPYDNKLFWIGWVTLTEKESEEHLICCWLTPWEEWDEFILSICLEVYDSFDVWTGKKEIEPNSDLKTLIILRQLAKGRITMMQLTHLLNIAYYIASEFKVIYKHSRWVCKGLNGC